MPLLHIAKQQLMIWKNNPVNKALILVGANSFAQRWLHIAMPRANEFAPTKNEE